VNRGPHRFPYITPETSAQKRVNPTRKPVWPAQSGSLRRALDPLDNQTHRLDQRPLCAGVTNQLGRIAKQSELDLPTDR
jgi:hypothetical protein